MNPPPRIALIGFMGSGKSTVGRILARRLGYGFTDLDSVVEARAGETIADIFRLRGEAAFRSLEAECLRELASRESLVLAVGGGAPLTEGSRGFFTSSASTFYLSTPLATALARLGRDDSRPLLALDPGALGRLYRSRLPVYSALGRQVRTDGKNPDEIAEEILLLLGITTPARDARRNGLSDP